MNSRSSLRMQRRILVVDDNRDTAASLAILLRVMGNVTHIVHDGRQALAAFDDFRPDIVMLDIGLPKLDGYETCRRIRNREHGREVIMVAVTGWAREEDRLKSEEAGFDRHLVKPVDQETLAELLAEAATSN